jgi:subtilase family protein
VPAGHPGRLVEQSFRLGRRQLRAPRPGLCPQGKGQRLRRPGPAYLADEIRRDRAVPPGVGNYSLMDTPSVYHKVDARLYFSQETYFRGHEQGIDMKFEEDHLGYAFEDDYPESYGPDDQARLRAIVPQQTGQLYSGDPSADARLLGILIGRRCGTQTLAQLEQRPHRRGFATLVARGEIVLPADAYPAVKELLTAYSPLPGNGSASHLRLRRNEFCASEVDRSVDACAVARVDAWPNYVATMAAVGKGIGGPEPAPAPPPSTPDTGGSATLAADTPASSAAATGRPAAGDSGAGPIRVAIIDTGITAQTRNDGWLDGVRRGAGNVDQLDLLPAGPDGLLDYGAGHGTFVAGIVARVAPQAEIVMYRAADTDGFATDDQIADAILEAHRDGAQVINVSLGVRTVDDQPPPALAAAVRTVLESSQERVIVAAAGNYGDTGKVFPAALEGVHAVAGLTAFLTPALWSSYGDVQFSTVAEGIHSTFVRGTESPVFDPSPDEFPGPDSADPWAVWSGTSFAAPQIAGAVARISYEEKVDVRAAVQKLADYGKQIAGYGKAMRILKGIG